MSPDTKEIISIIATPVLTLCGLLLGYLFNKNKVTSESNKLRAEKESMELTNDVATVKFYTDMIESLRKEVKLHTYQIKELTASLNRADEEKRILKSENEKLVTIVEEQGQKIIFLQSEIDKLNMERNDSNLPLSSPSK